MLWTRLYRRKIGLSVRRKKIDLRGVAACLSLLLLLLVAVVPAYAQQRGAASPAAAAEVVRSALLTAQMVLSADTDSAVVALQDAQSAWQATLAERIASADDAAALQIDEALTAAEDALLTDDAPAFAAARASIWTALLRGSLAVVEQAIGAGDATVAQQWLPVREFRQVTRFTRPNADATLALQRLAAGEETADAALQAVHADLLDSYQSRLNEALATLADAESSGFATRRAELAALAEGYFTILLPEYVEQRGQAAADAASSDFAAARTNAVAGMSVAENIPQLLAQIEGFRAAPLSPADQARRAGQMMRFLSLVPVEYGRGIRNGEVTVDLEIREAITFRDGAAAAYTDLRNELTARDASLVAQADELFASLDRSLAKAARREPADEPSLITSETNALVEILTAVMPPEWSKTNSAADFDVIGTALDQMEQAVAAGEYALAESARLEAYAILESGPEARLVAFAPQYIAPIEELFWYGQGENIGLASLLGSEASRAQIAATREALDTLLLQAQDALGGESSPTAILLNAAIIVFREGLEAVVILAALMASMVGARRVYRKPMAWGVVLAFIASIVTWWAMQTVLSAFRGYGERLEAVVSLIAIAVLLLITNWFFHRVYWTDWMADLHQRKKAILGSVAAGQVVGFLTLGFTSVYREGFETVLFLQALVLEAGAWTVIEGTLLGLVGVFLVGFITFKLQSRLPYKDMLIVTGVLISLVLVVMVGNTVHIMQLVGWMPLHPIRWLTLPYWMGMWFGVYPTWEGIAMQVAALAFVLGSYFVAERIEKRKPAAPAPAKSAPVGADAAASPYADAAAARIQEAKARVAKM